MESVIKVLPIPDDPTPLYVVFFNKSQYGEKLVRKYNKAEEQGGFVIEEFLKKELQ